MLLGIFGGLDVDAVGRTGSRAEEAGNALFQAIFIALEDMGAAEALLEFGAAQGAFAVGVILYLGGLQHFSEGDAHAFGDGRDIAHNRHVSSIRWKATQFLGCRLRRCLEASTHAHDG